MKDKYGKDLAIGDIVEQVVTDDVLPKGSQWRVVEFGIEERTKKNVALLKDLTKGYIASAYQCELKFFKKVEMVS